MNNSEQHQAILGFMYTYLSFYIDRVDGKVYLKGYPMYIERMDAAFEPDLMVIFKRNFDRIQVDRLAGAADIAIEISSPETDAIDRGEKFEAYENAGVEEYWLIDPKRKYVIIYALDTYQRYQVFSHTDQNRRTIINSSLIKVELDSKILWREKLPAGREVIQLLPLPLRRRF